MLAFFLLAIDIVAAFDAARSEGSANAETHESHRHRIMADPLQQQLAPLSAAPGVKAAAPRLLNKRALESAKPSDVRRLVRGKARARDLPRASPSFAHPIALWPDASRDLLTDKLLGARLGDAHAILDRMSSKLMLPVDGSMVTRNTCQRKIL